MELYFVLISKKLNKKTIIVIIVKQVNKNNRIQFYQILKKINIKNNKINFIMIKF